MSQNWTPSFRPAFTGSHSHRHVCVTQETNQVLFFSFQVSPRLLERNSLEPRHATPLTVEVECFQELADQTGGEVGEPGDSETP